MKRALILVDIQNDFLPGGALAVPEGDEVVPAANAAMKKFDLVVATQDWHPPDHGSFAGRHPGKKPGEFIILDGLEQILWPEHCVQNTPGAALAPGLAVDGIHHIVRKGMEKNLDSYSGFFDNGHRRETGLGEYLHHRRVDKVAIMGLATDYCVKYTALDARRLGFETDLIREGVRGVELTEGDIQLAIAEMVQAGVTVIGMDDL